MTQDRSDEVAERIAYALKLWAEAQPIAGTLAERYLAETRAIDVSKLPATIHDALRFHPHCAFGARARHTCLVALMRDPATDEAIGIHRIGLAPEDGKITKLDRSARTLGVVKLWPEMGTGGWSSAKVLRLRSRPPPASLIAALSCCRPGRR